MQKKLRMTKIFVHWFCPDFEWILTDACILIYTHRQELVKSMGRQWELVIACLHDEEEGDGSDMLFATLIRA
jgi:hypothetical protein